jgi:hypothetical protein
VKESVSDILTSAGMRSLEQLHRVDSACVVLQLSAK